MTDRNGNGSKNERRKVRQYKVTCECGQLTIKLRAPPADGRPPPLSGLSSPMSDTPYLFFSPLEEAVVRLLCARGPMTGDEIARELNESPTGKLKYMLANLVQRLILTGGNGGYDVNVLEGHNRQEFCARLLATLDRNNTREEVSGTDS